MITVVSILFKGSSKIIPQKPVLLRQPRVTQLSLLVLQNIPSLDDYLLTICPQTKPCNGLY